MGQGFLIDTSTVSIYLQGLYDAETSAFLDGIVRSKFLLSFVTKIELLSYNPPFIDEKVITYKQNITGFVSEATIVGMLDEIIEETIRIRKTIKLKLPDAIIAATAIVHELTLLSDNDSDFLKAVPLGLQYLNPKKRN
jgi:predicted nucleic acid-binding protein